MKTIKIFILTILFSILSCNLNTGDDTDDDTDDIDKLTKEQLIKNTTLNYQNIIKSIESLNFARHLITDCDNPCMDKYKNKFNPDNYHFQNKSHDDLVIFNDASCQILKVLNSYNSVVSTATINSQIDKIELSHNIFMYEIMHNKSEWALAYLKEDERIISTFNYQGDKVQLANTYISGWIDFLQTGVMYDNFDNIVGRANEENTVMVYNYASQLYEQIKNREGAHMDFGTFYSIINSIAKPPY